VELQKLEKKLVEKLSAAHSNEVEAQGKNPISHAVDLLALTDSQLQTWMKIYAKVDTDRSGAVEFDELCEFLNEPPTKFIKYVFDEMDTFNSDGVIEFADFLRSFAIFCMFGKDEVKRYVQ
jgi:Ca2+-binding EF-hand superfamily protein